MHISLPHHIIFFEILIRLPARTLQKFKSVCKLWQQLISDSNFVQAHLNQCRSQPVGCIAEYTIYQEDTIPYSRNFVYSCEATQERYDLKLHLMIPIDDERFFLIAASCDGLLLVEVISPNFFITQPSQKLICNPITRQSTKLPCLPSNYIEDRCTLVYDDVRDAYKVIVWNWNGKCPGLLVLELGTESWRELNLPQDAVRPFSEDCYLLNRIMCWFSWNQSTGENVAVAMDIASEQTREIRLPDYVARFPGYVARFEGMWKFKLMVIDESTYLLVRHTKQPCCTCTVWILEDLETSRWIKILEMGGCNNGRYLNRDLEKSKWVKIRKYLKQGLRMESPPIHHRNSLLNVERIQ